jgi:hypothetical protein
MTMKFPGVLKHLVAIERRMKFPNQQKGDAEFKSQTKVMMDQRNMMLG